MALTLHFHPLSSYCQKVLIALYETGAPFEGRFLDLGDPQARAAFLALWPLGKMPLLRDEALGRTIPETTIIIEHLDQHYPGAQPLIPREPEAALAARLWDRIFDLHVQGPLQQAVGARLAGDAAREAEAVAAARLALASAYGVIERHMAGRTWAAGESFSLADCAAAPALFFAAAVAPWPDSHANLTAYFEELAARPSVARAFAEARPYLQFFPFKEGLAGRFLGEG